MSKEEVSKNFLGLTNDQAKLFSVWVASFVVTSSMLYYFSTRDGTLKSNWIFLLYILVSLTGSYLYFSIII